MKFKAIFLSMVASLICISGYGQGNKHEEEDLLSTEEVSKNRYIRNNVARDFQLSTGANNSFVNTQGNNNVTNVDQYHTGGGDPNAVFIMQAGNNNGANLTQEGSGNNSSLVQDGNNNQYQGFVSGNGNNSNVNQFGNNNQLEHSLVGDNLKYELIQDGNNNRLIHSDYGTQSGPPQIIQQGNNMNLRIEQR